MAWVRLDEEFASNPKLLEAGPLGIAMQVAGLCYCNRHLTDGKLPRPAVATLLSFEGLGMRMWSGEMMGGGEEATWELVVEDMLDAGLWHEPGHDCEQCPPITAGYYIHGYLEFQPSRAEVNAAKAAKQAAGRKGGQARAQALATADAKQVPSSRSSKAEAESKPDTDTDTEEQTRGAASQPSKSRGYRLPDTFRLTDAMRAVAAEKYPSVDVQSETESFIDYWRAETGAKATKLDWDAAWRVWMARQQKWSKPKQSGVVPAGRAGNRERLRAMRTGSA